MLSEPTKFAEDKNRECLNPCCNGRCSLRERLPSRLRSKSNQVLILVVMEDALWAEIQRLEWHLNSLNPCCNGRCSLRVQLMLRCCLTQRLNPCCNGRCSLSNCFWVKRVDNKSLNPCCNGRCSLSPSVSRSLRMNNPVLILVVMEDALWDAA